MRVSGVRISYGRPLESANRHPLSISEPAKQSFIDAVFSGYQWCSNSRAKPLIGPLYH